MPFLSVNAERVAPFYDTRWFEDFDLIVGSDFDYNRYMKDTSRYHDFIAYYDSLRSRFTLAYEAVPKGQQPGPALWLFKPRPAGAALFDKRLFDRLAGVPESAWVSRFLKNLALLLMEKEKYGKTEQIAEVILGAEPTNIQVLRMLADALERLGRREEIFTRLDALITLHPTDTELKALREMLLLREGRENVAK
jgi:tetratricopeptide (TPR) repeat protein